MDELAKSCSCRYKKKSLFTPRIGVHTSTEPYS